MSEHIYTRGGLPLCPLPRITRHWRRLGDGATWTCACGRGKRLTRKRSPHGGFWTWERIEEVARP